MYLHHLVPMYRIIILFLLALTGCGNFNGIKVDIDNQLIKAIGYKSSPSCTVKSCSLVHKDDVYLYIDRLNQRVIYEIISRNKTDNEVISSGVLSNCRIFSKEHFSCGELDLRDNKFMIPIDFTKKISIGAFEKYEIISENALLAFITRFFYLDKKQAQVVIDYDIVLYIMIFFVVIIVIEKII